MCSCGITVLVVRFPKNYQYLICTCLNGPLTGCSGYQCVWLLHPHECFMQPAKAFKDAYESLGLQTSGGKSVNMQKIWHLLQVLLNEIMFYMW